MVKGYEDASKFLDSLRELSLESKNPGTAIAKISQLNPVACIVAFKHIHSGTVPTDPNFWGSNPVVPVVNDYDPREQPIYPPGTCVAPYTPPTTKEPAGT